MTTINFPASPTLNQIYQAGLKKWIWNGTYWQATSASELGGGGGGYTGSQGDLGYTGSQGVIGYTGSAGSGGGGTTINWLVTGTNYSASTGDNIIANTSSGTFTINLPSAPVLGHFIRVTDGADFSLNNLIIAANGRTIESQGQDLSVDIKSVDLQFIYDGSTWQIVATMGPKGSQGYTGSQAGTGKSVAMSIVFGG
jgi:hypothetical protein